MAIVAEGDRGRVYITPTREHETVAQDVIPVWKPENELAGKCRVQCFAVRYEHLRRPVHRPPVGGADHLSPTWWGKPANASATTRWPPDCRTMAFPCARAEPERLRMLRRSVCIWRLPTVDNAHSCSSFARWQNSGDKVAGVFARQAIPMMWDYAEVNVFSNSTQNWMAQVGWVVEVNSDFAFCQAVRNVISS